MHKSAKRLNFSGINIKNKNTIIMVEKQVLTE